MLALFGCPADRVELFSPLFARFTQLLRNEATLDTTTFVPALTEFDREADERAIVRGLVPHVEGEILAGDTFVFGIAGLEREDALVLEANGSARQPGAWWVRSLADVAGPKKLDLRVRDHAERLERVLSSLPLAAINH